MVALGFGKDADRRPPPGPADDRVARVRKPSRPLKMVAGFRTDVTWLFDKGFSVFWRERSVEMTPGRLWKKRGFRTRLQKANSSRLLAGGLSEPKP